MTIFKRDCPECAAANPPGALLCACGYCFDPDLLARTDPEAYARQQERLYLEYLNARLVQARTDAQAAREAAHAEPGDKSKAMALRGAEAALAALRTELGEHARRVPAGQTQTTVRPPAGTATAARSQPAAARTHAQAPPKPAATSAHPNDNFRRAQAQRANALVQSARSAARPPRVAPAPVPRAPVHASASAGGRGATQTCPNCTATVSADAERCRCGYAFARPGEAVPALALDAGALAILADGIRFTGPARRR